jgi:putative transposase
MTPFSLSTHSPSTQPAISASSTPERRTVKHDPFLAARPPSCLRLIRALAVETHEEWIDANRYLNMEPLRELLKKPAPERKVA